MNQLDELDQNVLLDLMNAAQDGSEGWRGKSAITRSVHGMQENSWSEVDRASRTIGYRLAQMREQDIIEWNKKSRKHRIRNAILADCEIRIKKVLAVTTDADAVEEIISVGACLLLPRDGNMAILFLEHEEK